MTRLARGKQLGSCTILEHLGVGLSGNVYKAIHKNKDMVALKVFSEEQQADRTVLGYFLNEQMLLREITEHRKHPNIVEYVTSRESPAPFYLGTRYIEGAQSLEKLMHMPLSAGFTLHVVENIASALDYLHYGNSKYSPIIHRDVKPHNVLIGASNQVILIDLSIARFPAYVLEDERGLGTMEYMPPEQYEGQEVPATDQFALAVMALKMLTGTELLPRDKRAARDRLLDLRDSDHGDVRDCLGSHTYTADTLVKALQYSPADRYATCEEFAYALRQALLADGLPVDEVRSPLQSPRSYLEYGGIALVALIAVALLAYSLGLF